jgi:hypothetical protein
LQIENECLRYPQQLHAFNMIQDMPTISQSQDVPFHSTWRAWHLWHLKHCNPKFAMKHWNLGSLELETWKLGSQIGRGTWLELGRVELGRPLERVGTCTIVWNRKHSVGSKPWAFRWGRINKQNKNKQHKMMKKRKKNCRGRPSFAFSDLCQDLAILGPYPWISKIHDPLHIKLTRYKINILFSSTHAPYL